MDFDLTDEQRAIQETVREFVDRRVLPVAQENDINHHLDMGIIEGMAELGLLGPVIPPEYGGSGLDYVSEALICEEIERGESAFRTLISVHVGLNSLSLLKYGSEEQKQRWLTPQAKGEKLACFGLTEPGAGSDVASMRSTARREGDTYLLNGQKNWISYATEADYALVFAKTDPTAGHRGISAFVVEREWEGVEARRIPNKLGIWAGSRVERALGRKDPGVIVIDEVAGMLLSVVLLPRSIPVLVTAFLLFRLFDIWKPFPARESQALTGGVGVMVDDLIAGLYTLVLVMGARALFGVPA